jgi:arginase
VPAPAGRRGLRPGGVLNEDLLPAYSSALADAVGVVIDAGEFPVVLGGDCSILLGTSLALRKRGRFGLLFLDAHADFYQPEADVNGEAASMDLALATGRGPAVLTDLAGPRPLVRDDDVVVVGQRDAEVAANDGSRPLDPAIRLHDLRTVRAEGADAVARHAIAHLTRSKGPGRFWIHLDVDVLNDELMPAVDYRLPDGLDWEELHMLLGAAVGSPGAVGLEVTIFNPDLDPDGSVAQGLTAELGHALLV